MIHIQKPDDVIRSFVMDKYTKQSSKKNHLTFLSMILIKKTSDYLTEVFV